MHIGKAGTDVLLIGSAWAPDKRPVTRMQVGMSVGGPQKTILVTGDRVWRDGQPSDPQPFESMPLVWERAFGGVHRSGDKVAGRGAQSRWAADSPADVRPATCKGSPSPTSRIRRRRCSRSARSRAGVSGADRAVMAAASRVCRDLRRARGSAARAPYLPDDFDPRFFQCAAPEFAFDRYLQAGRTRAGRRRDAGRADRLHGAGLASERRGDGRRDRPQTPPAQSRDAVDRARREPRVLHLARGGAVRSAGAEGREDRRGRARAHRERGRSARRTCSARSAAAPIRCGRRRAPASRGSATRT